MLGRLDPRRLALWLVLLGLGWAALLVGVGFGLGALYMLLARFWVAAAAAVATAAVGIVVGLIVLRAGRPRRPPPSVAPMEIVRLYPLETAAAALAAGVIVGRSDAARAAVVNGLTTLITRYAQRAR